MLFRTIIIVSMLLLIDGPSSARVPQGSHSYQESTELSASAKLFLWEWLVNRDVREAMRYVVTKPILARKCDLPPKIRSVPSSARQRRDIVEQILSAPLKALPKYASLDSAIEPSNIPESDWFDIEASHSFQILRIKPGKDGSLMCKFEKGAEYRQALLRPNVYYVSFKIKNRECPTLSEWISAWAKEGQQWRLLSIGLLED